MPGLLCPTVILKNYQPIITKGMAQSSVTLVFLGKEAKNNTKSYLGIRE
jgi:hypothetical protein